MPGIAPSRPFIPVNIAVLTVSDRRDAGSDRSGDTLVQRLTDPGHRLAARAIVKDEVPPITAQLPPCIAADGVEVVIATGGPAATGPDATRTEAARVGEACVRTS